MLVRGICGERSLAFADLSKRLSVKVGERLVRLLPLTPLEYRRMANVDATLPQDAGNILSGITPRNSHFVERFHHEIRKRMGDDPGIAPDIRRCFLRFGPQFDWWPHEVAEVKRGPFATNADRETT